MKIQVTSSEKSILKIFNLLKNTENNVNITLNININKNDNDSNSEQNELYTEISKSICEFLELKKS